MTSLRVRTLVTAGLLGLATASHADAVDALRAFVRDVKSGRADFTQTVTSPDGARQRQSSGTFSFARPNRFRFDYTKPYPQTIVGDGQKVWYHDPDLNQVTVRQAADALGSSPVALLAGADIEREFELKGQAPADGLEWVQATPRVGGGTIQWLKAGFKGKALVAVEIADSFGQRSVLRFPNLSADPVLAADTFRFVVPAGADVSPQ